MPRLRRAGIRNALALLAAVAIAGCQDTATGIFHHLAHQEPTVDRTLPNDLTVGGVVRWGDRYLVAAGKLWSRPTGSGDWVPVTSTYDGAAGSATLLPLVRWQPGGKPVLLAGTRFASDAFALLQADGDRVKAASIAWKRVTVPAVKGREVIGLFTPDADESVLFAVVAANRGQSRSYTLLRATVRSEDGMPEFETVLDGLERPATAIASNGASDADRIYWAVAGGDIYRGTRDALKEAPAPENAGTLGGVLYHEGTLFLSGSDGKLWRSMDDGQTWSDPHTAAQVAGQTVAFTGLAPVGSTVLVGTDGFGYYTVDLDGDLSAERLPFTTEALYTASIPGFWIDPDGPDEEDANASTVFALTNGDGLLSASVTRGAPPERWQQE